MHAPLIETRRVKRRWIERILLWARAYETKLWQSGHEVTGRGPTPKASEAAAIKKWNEENSEVTAPLSKTLGDDDLGPYSQQRGVPV